MILITTKKGRASEKPSITYSTNFAWNTPTVMPKLAKAYENAQALLLMAEREGGSSVTSVGYNIDDLAVQKMKEWYDKYHGMSEEELGEIQEGRDFEFRGGKYYWYRDFDPIEMFMRKWASQQNHNLTISGGTDKTTYSMGLGFLKQTGSLKFNPDNNQRYTITPSISTQINKWLRVHGSVMYTHDSYARPYRFTSGVYDMWYYLLRWPSFYPYGIYVIDTDKVPTQKQFETGSFVFGPGDIKYKDLNGDGKIDYGSNTVDDHGDLKVIGNSRPLFEYSFNLGLTYKGLGFSTFFQGVGRKNVVPLGSVGTPGFTYEAMFEHQMDYWTPENPNAYYPRLAHNGNLVGNSKNFKTQTKYLLNLAYLRLKNLTVGYTLPESLSSTVGLQSLRVYLSGENLFEFYDKKIPVDPETSTYKSGNWADAFSFGRTFPFSRTISVGAQVRF